LSLCLLSFSSSLFLPSSLAPSHPFPVCLHTHIHTDRHTYIRIIFYAYAYKYAINKWSSKKKAMQLNWLDLWEHNRQMYWHDHVTTFEMRKQPNTNHSKLCDHLELS
jgi:hypothetical protein